MKVHRFQVVYISIFYLSFGLLLRDHRKAKIGCYWSFAFIAMLSVFVFIFVFALSSFGEKPFFCPDKSCTFLFLTRAILLSFFSFFTIQGSLVGKAIAGFSILFALVLGGLLGRKSKSSGQKNTETAYQRLHYCRRPWFFQTQRILLGTWCWGEKVSFHMLFANRNFLFLKEWGLWVFCVMPPDFHRHKKCVFPKQGICKFQFIMQLMITILSKYSVREVYRWSWQCKYVGFFWLLPETPRQMAIN